VRAEVGSHQFDLHSLGGSAFQQTAQRIHRLLFDEDSEEGARAAAELGFHDIRIAY
jgi:NitT/TauT family transport system ATP-binding protein